MDRDASQPESTRTLVDMLATLKVNDKLTLIINYDWAEQNLALLSNGTYGKAKWNGVAGYVNYQVNDQLLASLRGEYFDDDGGFRTGVNQHIKAVTFSLTYVPNHYKNVGIRGELRKDYSNAFAYLPKDNGPKRFRDMASGAIEAYILFG